MDKIIKDPVHGYISLSKKDLDIIDTFIFQRLKRIKHLPADVVYPGATHTRFEHSLGVMALSEFIFQTLKEQGVLAQKILTNEDEYKNTLRYAALLHDVGHTPLSHVCEKFGEDRQCLSKVLKRHGVNIKPKGSGASHEWTSCAIALDYFDDILKQNEVDLDLFCRTICGVPFEGEDEVLNPLIEIINSQTDADKLDYILRDSLMTGAVLTSIDKDRIIRSFTVVDNRLALSKQALSVITQLIYGRDALYLWVYTHHAVVYYQSLIQRYLMYLIDHGVPIQDLFSLKSLVNGMDDHELYHLLRKHKDDYEYTKRLFEQIFSRRFYKTLWKNPFECIQVYGFSDLEIEKLLLDPPEQLEQAIIKEFNLPEFSVFVYEASFKPFEGYLSNILIGIGEKTFHFESIFEERIYKIANPKILANVPYVRLDPQIYCNTRIRNKIIEWLHQYSPY